MNQIIVLREFIAAVSEATGEQFEQHLFNLDYRLMHAQAKLYGSLCIGGYVMSHISADVGKQIITDSVRCRSHLLQLTAYAEAYWLLRRISDGLIRASDGNPPTWYSETSSCIAEHLADYEHVHKFARPVVSRVLDLLAEHVPDDLNMFIMRMGYVADVADKFSLATGLRALKNEKTPPEIVEDLMFNLPTMTLRDLSRLDVDGELKAEISRYVRNEYDLWHTSVCTARWRTEEESRTIIDGVDHSIDHPDNMSASIVNMLCETLQFENVESLG